MLTRRFFAGCALCAAAGLIASEADAQSGAPAAIKRTILQQTDGPTEGYVTIIARAEILPNAIVMRHTHPGIESAYVVQGGGTLSVKGQSDRVVVPGDAFQIPQYTPHGLRNGEAATIIAGTYVLEKGKPFASPAPE
jgi:quercetin dioxygenase-like cupin family protein